MPYPPQGNRSTSGTATELAAGATFADALLPSAANNDLGSTTLPVDAFLGAGTVIDAAITGVSAADATLASILAALGMRHRAITGADSLVLADLGGVVEATSGTFALAMASSLGASFSCVVWNSGTGVVTLTPSGGAATIDGAATFALPQGQARFVFLTSTSGAWKTVLPTTGSLVLIERTAPAAVADAAVPYAIDESGTTALRVRFGTNDIRIAKDSAAAAYTVSNESADRTFDVSTVTLTELANVVAALLQDLADRTTFVTVA